MKISRRDKYLLGFLAVFLLIAAYYFFLMVPQEKKIKELETTLIEKENIQSTVRMKISSEKNLDKSIDDLEKVIAETASQYYSEISQEDMLATITSFTEGLSMNFNTMNFSDNVSPIEGAIKYTASVAYSGDYDSLLAYIRNVRGNDRKILIREITANNTMQGVGGAGGEEAETIYPLSGSLLLEFNAIPSTAAYANPAPKLVTSQMNTRDLLSGPFEPFLGFEVATEPAPSEMTDLYPEFPYEETTEVDYENYRPKTQIYGFEDGSNFFVANNADISGMLSRSKTKIAGGFSAELVFDFAAGRDYSEANIVFDSTPVMINKQADFIGLWVYAYESSNHGVGVVIIDSKGKEFKVPLASTIDWTQWKELEAEMPVEITYPCMIQRIYVEGIGYEQKLTGKYLFDQLQVSYPVN